MPSDRAHDVVLFDPADDEYVVGWNILGAGTEVERELLASDLVAVFRRLSTSWGDQMTSVLSNAVLAFLDSTRGGTLLDLRQFLVDARFRRDFLQTVPDPYLRSWWEQEFSLLVGKKPQAPILTRLDTFLRSKRIRELVTVRQGLDFRALVDGGKIFLAKLSQGAIGVENAALLGSLLVSKIHQVTLSRQDQVAEARRPFFLYLDEFHEVATPSMATLFSGVRKYRLGLVVAHQDLYQLHSKAPDVERSVLSNAHTRICFRLGDDDARSLGKGFSYFTPEDLMGLRIGEAIARVGGRDSDFNLRTEKLDVLDPEEAREQRAAIRQLSLEQHGEARSRPEPAPQVATQAEARPPRAPTATAAEQPKSPVQELKAEPPSQLSKDMLDYLELVAQEPFLTVRERNAELGLSAWKGQKLKTRLVEEGLTREVAVNPGGRGERFQLLELTSSGRSLLASLGVSPAKGHGRGGLAHQWWVKTVAEWLQEQGFETAVEDESHGARVDLLVSHGREAIAIEVETSEGHVVENIRKDLDAGFETVISLLDNPEALQRIEHRLQETLGEPPQGVLLGNLRDYQDILAKLALTPSASLRPANQDQEPGRTPSRRRRRKRARQTLQPVQGVFLADSGALTTPMAAEYLGLSPATLETKRTRGGGPPFVKLGRRVVYRKEDLDAWLEERRKRSTSG